MRNISQCLLLLSVSSDLASYFTERIGQIRAFLLAPVSPATCLPVLTFLGAAFSPVPMDNWSVPLATASPLCLHADSFPPYLLKKIVPANVPSLSFSLSFLLLDHFLKMHVFIYLAVPGPSFDMRMDSLVVACEI